MRNDRNVGIHFFFFFFEKYDKVSCMHLGHTRRVNSLSPEVVKLSLSVIVVENGMRCDERTRALALIPGYLQVSTSSLAFLTAGSQVILL